MEEERAKELVNAFKSKNDLDYVNLTDDNQYLGWVYDFHIELNNEKMFLNLNKENDLFLLFALAIAWSRSGQWENAGLFVTHLKFNNKDYPEYWLDKNSIQDEIRNRRNNATEIMNEVSRDYYRDKISFRKDIFASMNILATNWGGIKEELENCYLNSDYLPFMNYLRNIKGLRVNNNRIYIKIPLILRELRCQQIYDNIPGELCCVPDERVKEACNELDIKLPSMYKRDIDSLIKYLVRFIAYLEIYMIYPFSLMKT
ncbi:hypothetical protein [Methanobacterium sp.]|uniref:hypothetical protein n=1 Tax=Methanobacterium sp. TaxID=2164 RepID=UPI002AB9EF9D|nr:hypothetical protein [Methanobacterium sp.]MDY9924377.1 hypothetical protein [Methanobacterium sp.]